MITEQQSQTITFLRFPMALCVVFIHAGVIMHSPAEFHPVFSAEGIDNLIKVFFSGKLPLIAVPLFYMISGWLFFNDFNHRKFQWNLYRKKTRKRIKSLLIPYLLWNTIAVIPAVFILKDELLKIDIINRNYTGLVRIYWDHSGGHFPLDFPLWFIRDLIIMTIISPICFYIITRFKEIALGILAILFVFSIIPDKAGFSMKALFFFSLGCYMSRGGGFFI